MSSKNGLPFDNMKEGSLKRMLSVKKDDPPLKIGELQKFNKTEIGSTGTFRGREKKMTPLLKKRVTLAINLIRASKGKKK
tara:strand:+ start:241 stop:480 length:240 start_codon:yes stop_codon:yes gene_type:complete